MRRLAVAVVVFLITLAFDQGSKAWARTLPVHPTDCDVPGDLLAHRCVGVPQPVVEGFWDWELAFNPGAAFSSFAGSRVALTLVALFALVGLGVMAQRTLPEERLKRAAYATIAGGALGNLIDRVRHGAVTDFVRWKVDSHNWPIFNVADAALLVGVVLLVAEMVIARRRAVTLAA